MMDTDCRFQLSFQKQKMRKDWLKKYKKPFISNVFAKNTGFRNQSREFNIVLSGLLNSTDYYTHAMLTMLYSTRSLDYRFGHRSHMLFAVTGRRVCIITWSGLSEGFQFHPEHIICSVDSFSIVSLGKMIQLQMHFGFNQSLQLDSSASNEQHKNNFFTPFYNAIFTTTQ